MDVNMEITMENLESENIELIDALKNLETENHILAGRLNMLEKKMEKEKKFHRKFADEVSASESLRSEDFRKEKQAIVEENKSFIRENRQLKKDVDFYKKAHAELTKEDELGGIANSFKQIQNPRQEPSLSKSTRASRFQSIVYLPTNCTHKSAKVLGKTNDKLYEDNKKLRLKISSLNADAAILKRKIKQLENFKVKIDNKKAKFLQDSELLEEVVASTRTTNKDVYNSDVLAMFGKIS